MPPSLAVRMIAERFHDLMPRGAMIHLDGHGAVRLDAAVATAFVEQELEFVKMRTYDIKRVALKIRTLLPVSFEAHPGAEVTAYDSYDAFGEARIIESYADDFPRVDAEKERHRDIVFGLGISYGFSVQDLRAIAMSGSRLDTQRPMQARRGMETKLERIGAEGVPAKGTTGFVNNADIPLFGSTLSWTMATAALDIMADLQRITQAVVTQSADTWEPDTLAMSHDAYAVATGVTFGTDSPISAMGAFLRQSPYIRQVEQWAKLTGAGAGAGEDRLIAYKRDEDVAVLEIPQDYEEFPPETRGLEFVTHGHMRTAGVSVKYPLACQYADGTFDPAS